MTKWTLVVVGIACGTQAALAQQGVPRASSCTLAEDKASGVKPAAGRAVYCALDVGSKNLKLSVVSMEPGKNTTVKDERLCKRALGLGAQVYAPKTGAKGPLPAGAIELLAETVREFQGICTLDGGKLVGAAATQWARDATNIAEVRASLRAKTGIDVDVLTPAQEAELGYVTGALGKPGRVVLDPGSNSFQLMWQSKRTGRLDGITVPWGYVRASAAEFEPARDFAVARRNYEQRVRARIDTALAELKPPLDLAHLRGLVTAGELQPTLVTFGQDGNAALVVRYLRDANGSWVADVKGYDAALRRMAPEHDAEFGVMASEPMPRAELEAFLARLGPADFKALTTDPIKDLYGQRALVLPVLVELLLEELGAKRLVSLPQELSTGFILSKLAPAQ